MGFAKFRTCRAKILNRQTVLLGAVYGLGRRVVGGLGT